MFQIYPWPNVILHLDGDAFFASVTQAINPLLRGKPLVTGAERGIATAVSYEAKKLGVIRGMRTTEIRKKFPQCLIVDSDYTTYQLFSLKMFEILKSFTPLVEEYSIDEGFADIKGLQRPLNKNYLKIGKAIKEKIENSLGISVSIGISITKSLAKLASAINKPSGLMVVDGLSIEKLLAKIDVSDVWGIGQNTAAYLRKLGINTAFGFALQKEEFITSHLTKPFYEIWKELRGEKVYDLNFSGKQSYKSITRSQTFYPAINNQNILWARLIDHIEEAFKKARHLNYQVGKLAIFLKTQDFSYKATEIKLFEKTSYPLLIRSEIKKAFFKIYKNGVLYRSTGCTISDLTEKGDYQQSLFSETKISEEKVKKIYPILESKKIDFGTCLFDRVTIERNKKKMRLKTPMLSFINIP